MSSEQLLNSPLGKLSHYVTEYDPGQLCPIPRVNTWEEFGYEKSPYTGCDIWNAYELSWLNEKGLPLVVIAEIWIPVESLNLIESKSFKLYLNSFSQTKFKDIDQVSEILESDLSACAGGVVKVNLLPVNSKQYQSADIEGTCLDDQDISIEVYHRDANLLEAAETRVTNEKLYSHLLKTNCPVTGQPDWGSISIEYTGKQIVHTSLLKYIISYRTQTDFHEQCTENIFLDIMQHCQPDELAVYTRYLRRGGLDINPYRSTKNEQPQNLRLFRQ